MAGPSVTATRSWFGGRAGRRYGVEIALLIVLKLLLLTALWFFCFRPIPRPHLDADGISRHLIIAAPPGAGPMTGSLLPLDSDAVPPRDAQAAPAAGTETHEVNP